MEYTLGNFNKLPRIVISISPQRYDEKKLTTERCRDVVASSQVRVRGWYFPHINREGMTTGPRGVYVQDETEERGYHLEQWRMHTSGQFLFRMMPWEVPNNEVQDRMRSNARHWDSKTRVEDVPGFLSFIMLIYTIAEAYVFAARLAQAAEYDSALDLQIGLRGIRGWALGSNDFGVDLFGAYIAKNDVVLHDAEIALDILIADPLDAAVQATTSLFEQFGWISPDPAMMSNWQRQIFKGRR